MQNRSRFTSGTWLRGQALALTGALGLLVVPQAEAGFVFNGGTNTYSFTGQNYVTVFDGGNVPGSYKTSEALSWSMTLAAPLGNGLGFGAVSPTGWTFDDGRSSGNGTFDDTEGFAYFAAGTNGSGDIVDWLAAFVGPRLGGTTPNNSDDTGLGISCGGLGCSPLGAPTGEAGAALLWSSKAVSQIEQQIPGGGPGAWDSVFAAVDGTSAIAEFAFGAAEIGPNIGLSIGGLSEDDVDAAYYPAYRGTVPEPGALALVCVGLMGAFVARRRAQRQA